MKPQLIRPPQSKEETIVVQEIKDDSFQYPWHFHPEVELTFILKGEGTRFVGDSIERFQAGDVVLVGANLPHVWQSHKTENPSQVHAIVIHFKENFYGDDFSNLPEMAFLPKVQSLSKQGVKLLKMNSDLMILAQKMITKNSYERIFTLLNLLRVFAENENIKLLSTEEFTKLYTNPTHRFDKIYDYVVSNFHKPIALEYVAAMSNLTKTSFCRFFKTHTGKSFSTFLKELRIQYACQLLNASNQTIRSIAFQSGYNNLSNFNHHFKQVTGVTPKTFKKG